MVETCSGWLVVHQASRQVTCTEADDGRHCPGLAVHHDGGALSCRLLPSGRCGLCTPSLVGATERPEVA
jgi:hypothetical protein